MKRAGEVVGAAQGVAVVRSSDGSTPAIGTSVVDESLDSVGTVVDVFGPVGRPYLAVSPEGVDPVVLVGEALYTRDPRPSKP